jgi:hypothetical protein
VAPVQVEVELAVPGSGRRTWFATWARQRGLADPSPLPSIRADHRGSPAAAVSQQPWSVRRSATRR